MGTRGRSFSFSNTSPKSGSGPKISEIPVDEKTCEPEIRPSRVEEPTMASSYARGPEVGLGGGPSRGPSLERETPLAWLEELARNYSRISSINFFHHSLDEPAQANIISTNGSNMNIRFGEDQIEAVVFPGDPIQFSASTPERVYVANGRVESVNPTDGAPEYNVSISSVIPKENMRRFERFTINRPGRISIGSDYDGDAPARSVYALVRDASLGGFKIYCQEELDKDKLVYLTVFTDKNTGITSEVSVIEKIVPNGFYYIYRVQIHSISDVDQDGLVKYLNKCKTGDLGN